MLRLIDRLAKRWLRWRGIATVIVNGGTVRITENVDTLTVLGGSVYFEQCSSAGTVIATCAPGKSTSPSPSDSPCRSPCSR